MAAMAAMAAARRDPELETIARESAAHVIAEVSGQKRARAEDEEAETETEAEAEAEPQEQDYESGEAWHAEWREAERDGRAERLPDLLFRSWADAEAWEKLRVIWRRRNGHPKSRWYMIIGCQEPNAWLGSMMALYSIRGGAKGYGMTLRLLHDSSTRHFDDPLLVTSRAQYAYKADNRHMGLGWDQVHTADWTRLRMSGEYRKQCSAHVTRSRFDYLMHSATAGTYNEPQGTPRAELEARLQREMQENALTPRPQAPAPAPAPRARGASARSSQPSPPRPPPPPPPPRSIRAVTSAIEVQRRERLEALQKVTTLTRALDESHDEQVAALQRDLERERARNASHAEAIKEKQAELEAREGKLAEREAAFEQTKVATRTQMSARFAAERASLDAYKNRLDNQRTALLQAVGAVGRATLAARLAEGAEEGAAEGAEPVD